MIAVTNINGSLPLLVKYKCKSSNMPYCGPVIRLQKKVEMISKTNLEWRRVGKNGTPEKVISLRSNAQGTLY